MLARIPGTITDVVASFTQDSRGTIAVTFGIAFIPLTMAIGVALDYSRANDVRASLQAALDSAVLAGAKDGTTTWSDTALNTFNANLVTKGSSVSTPTHKIRMKLIPAR